MDHSTPSQLTIKRFFKSGFTIGDVAEAIASFDADRPAREVREFMKARGFETVGVRQDGNVCGFVHLDDLGEAKTVGECVRPFSQAIVMEDATPMHLAMAVLDESPCVFVAVLGSVGGIMTREDMEKPVARMWLFGLVILIEMAFQRLIQSRFPDGAWEKSISPSRLAKAKGLYDERRRRNQDPTLLSCLYFADRGHILFQDEDIRKQFGFDSRAAAQRAVTRVERLRNCLAHSHDLVTDNWEIIVSFSMHVDRLMRLLDL